MNLSAFLGPLRGLLVGSVLCMGLGLFAAEGPVQEALPLPEELYPRLKTILEAALSQSPQMLQRNIDIAQAEATSLSTNSILLPNVGGSISYVRSIVSSASTSDSKSQSDGLNYGFSASQPLFQWGTLKAQTQSAKIGVLIAEKNFAEAYRQLALQVRLQFLGLIIKKQALSNSAHGLNMTASILALQEEKLRTGLISPGEILGARLALEEATLGRDRALSDLEQGLRFFSRMTGSAAMRIDEIPDQIKYLGQPSLSATTNPLVSKFIGGEIKNMPQARIYHHYIEQMDLAYKVAKYRLYPKFYLSAGYSLGNTTSVSDNNAVSQSAVTAQTLSVVGSWTIFDGFVTKASKMSVLASKRSYQMQFENYLLATSEQAKDLERQLGFLVRAMKLAETRRSIQAGSLEFAQHQQASGLADQQDIESTRQSFNQAELSANMARADVIGKWTEFLSALNLDPAMKSLPAKYLRHAK